MTSTLGTESSVRFPSRSRAPRYLRGALLCSRPELEQAFRGDIACHRRVPDYVAVAVVGSITRLTSTIRSAGKPLSSACLRTSFSRSEEHTSELQSLMRISYAGFCLKKKT